MKLTRKIIAVGMSVLIIGVVVWVVGMSLIDWNFSRLDTTEYTAQSYTCDSEVKSISVSLSSFPLTVKKGDGVSLDYYKADNSEVFVEEKDGVLSIVENYKYKPFKSGLFNVGRGSHKFTLTIVSTATFKIKGHNSDVLFEGVIFDEFSIESNNADIRFSNVEIGKLDMDVDNCEIEFNDCAVGTLSVVGINTDCEFSKLTADSASVETVNADIYMDHCKISDLNVEATNLDITTKNCEFKSVMLDGTNADCELLKVVLDKLSIDATNLDADIEIIGNESEYTVRASGRAMPSNRTGTTDKLIELNGTNNDVTLKFV